MATFRWLPKSPTRISDAVICHGSLRRPVASRIITVQRFLLPARRNIHASSKLLVQVGDSIPDTELRENSPGNKVSLARQLAEGKGLIIGIPGAFSPSCSASHVPGYLAHPSLTSAGQIFVVSVNDPFVMKAWADTFHVGPEPKPIRFLADPHATFTQALDLGFDGAAPIFGQLRSKRYALRVVDGKVTELFVEPDNTGVNVSAADKVLA